MIKKTLLLLFLTIICGGIIGILSAVFLKLLNVVTTLRESYGFLVYLLPIAGVFTAIIYKKFGKGSEKGNNLIIDSVHKDINAPIRVTFLTFIFTVLTHLSGGSAGREGTAVQMGGSITNKFSEWFHLDRDSKRILVMSGISAGFGSVFGTPMAGAFFGMEVCFVGKLSYESILPCFIASFAGNAVVSLLGVHHAIYNVSFVPDIDIKLLIITILSSCLFGVIGKAFSITIQMTKKIYRKLFRNYILRAIAAASVVLLIYICFGLTRYDGLSTWMIDKGFDGKSTIFDPMNKFILTCLTLGAGLQGGEVTPLFDIGASIGGYIGQVTATSPSLFAAAGMIAVFGCATNTPIAAIVLGIEMFGTQAVPYFIFAVIISYYISGYSGIYSSQVIATSKSGCNKNYIGLLLGDIPQNGIIKLLKKKFDFFE